MPELHIATPAPAGASAAVLGGASGWAEDDYGFALGCECADPSLQIERWGAAEPQADTD